MPGRSKHPHIGLRPNAGSESNSKEYIFADATLGFDGTTFQIAPKAFRLELSTDVMDITGEFDGNLSGNLVKQTKMRALNYVKGRATFSGDVPSAAAIGLANLETATTLDVAFLLGVGASSITGTAATNFNRVKFRMVPQSVVLDWNLERPVVNITITGQLSERYNAGSLGDADVPVIEAQGTL